MNLFGALTFLAVIVFRANAIGIDDKLDFGGEERHHTAIRNDGYIRRNSFLPLKQSSTVTEVATGDGFDKIGIVCVNGGCNATKTSDNSEDTIKTDVVVHVKTKVNFDSNKSKPIDDTPDVPIVIGTDSSNSNINNNNEVRIGPKSIYIPSNEPRYFENSGSRNFKSFGTLYPTSVSSYPYNSNRRIDSTTSYYNFPNPSPEVNINIKSLPPVAINLADANTNALTANYKPKELTVPYLDPYYHNHHYGETPPPQFVYYPKRPIMNPVEFKVMSNWKPSLWQNQFMMHRHTAAPMGKEVNCFCENRNVPTDLHWYPNNNRRSSVFSSGGRVALNDPGSQINDKLAPLN